MSRPPSSWHKDDHVERAGFKGLREFLQKLRVEAHQGPLPLDDGGEHVVMDQALAPHVWVKVVSCPPGAQPDTLPLEVLMRLLR